MVINSLLALRDQNDAPGTIDLEAVETDRAIITYRDFPRARPKAVLLVEMSDGRVTKMQDYRRLTKAQRVARESSGS